MKRKVATFFMAGGGTGGHVFPALAVARELRARGHSVGFIGTRQGMEAKLVPAESFPIQWIENTFGAERIPERYVSSKKEFHLEAEVEHDPIVSATQISVWHNGQKVKEGSGHRIDADLTLVRGFNEVEIVAIHETDQHVIGIAKASRARRDLREHLARVSRRA